MDPQTLPTSQTTQHPVAQTPINRQNILKVFTNLRINRRAFLLGLILYHAVYNFSLNAFIAWEDPLVDLIYFPLFYVIWHITLMLFFIWRLHDINRSGYWVLIILILRLFAHIPELYYLLLVPRMIVDSLFAVFLLFKKGSESTNDYTEKPKLFSNLF